MFAPICHDKPQGILGKACPGAHGVNSMILLDNEFSIDLNKLPDFIKADKAIIKKTPTAFPMIGILIRFSDTSDIYMSTAYGRQSAHIEFYLWNRNDRYNRPSGSLAGYQTILQTLANKFNGRSHWGKSGLVYHNRDSLEMKLDDTARDNFLDVMNRYDPNEMFINNFSRLLKRTGMKVDFDSSTTHCALLDNCFCKKNLDCGATQICGKIEGYEYNVCKTRNEIAPVTFDKNSLPSPGWLATGFGPYFATVIPSLVKSVVSNCSVTDVLGTVLSLLSGFNPLENVLQTVDTLADQVQEIDSLDDIVGAAGDIFNGIFSG